MVSHQEGLPNATLTWVTSTKQVGNAFGLTTHSCSVCTFVPFRIVRQELPPRFLALYTHWFHMDEPLKNKSSFFM